MSDESIVKGMIDTPSDQDGQPTGQQSRSPSEQRGSLESKTVGDTLAPVMDFEKTDVEFWLAVTQTVLLLFILLELRG